jgi:hypothetical protein
VTAQVAGRQATSFGPNEDWTQGPSIGTRGTFLADVTGRADASVEETEPADAGLIVMWLGLAVARQPGPPSGLTAAIVQELPGLLRGQLRANRDKPAVELSKVESVAFEGWISSGAGVPF